MLSFRERSDVYKTAAKQFIADQRLEQIFARYGKFKYFGSYELDLMNRNDVDVALVVDVLSISTVTSLMQELNSKGFNRHWVFDNTGGGCKADSLHIVYESVYGFYNDNVDPSNRWELGLVLTTEEILPDVLSLTMSVQQLSSEEKVTILKLKFELARKYGVHKYSGSQVYRSVIEGKCTSVKDFVDYISI